MSNANINLDDKLDFDTDIKLLIDEKKQEYLEKIMELQAEFNQIENQMTQERLDQGHVEEQAKELRKKSSAHIDYTYRSTES